MTQPHSTYPHSDPTPAAVPSGPIGPRGERILKYVVVILGIILVVGFLALVFIIAQRAVNLAEDDGVQIVEEPRAPQGFSVLDVEVEPDTLVSQIEVDGDRMVLHVSKGAADEIIIIDIRTGQLLGRVKLIEIQEPPAE